MEDYKNKVYKRYFKVGDKIKLTRDLTLYCYRDEKTKLKKGDMFTVAKDFGLESYEVEQHGTDKKFSVNFSENNYFGVKVSDFERN